MTGTFIVLAAWNGLSTSINSSSRPSNVRNATAISAPLEAMICRTTAAVGASTGTLGFCWAWLPRARVSSMNMSIG